MTGHTASLPYFFFAAEGFPFPILARAVSISLGDGLTFFLNGFRLSLSGRIVCCVDCHLHLIERCLESFGIGFN